MTTETSDVKVERVVISETCPTCGQESTITYREFSVERDGIVLTARVREHYKLGNPTEVEVRLHNHTDRPVVIGRENGWREFGLDLRTAAGPVAMTEFGRQVLPPSIVQVGSAHSLHPGDYRRWSLDLQRVYRLLPGNMTLSLSRGFAIERVRKELKLTEIPIRVVLPDERGGGSRTQ